MSWFSRVIDNTVKEVKRAWDRTRKEVDRAGRKIDREFSNAWRTVKSNTYDKVRREMRRSPYARYAATLISVVYPPITPVIRALTPDPVPEIISQNIEPLMKWVNYEGGEAVFEKDVAPPLKTLGRKAGRFIGKNVDYDILVTAAIASAALVITGGFGSPFLNTLGRTGVEIMTDLWAADYASGGGVSEGYTSTFFDGEVELEGQLVWDYNPVDLYPWYPGSYEWSEYLAGGDMFNPADIVEPWEIMNGNQTNTDYTGYLLSNFYDGENPAAPDMNFPGNGFMELYGD